MMFLLRGRSKSGREAVGASPSPCSTSTSSSSQPKPFGLGWLGSSATLEGKRSGDGGCPGGKRRDRCSYRSQLEMEVRSLQKQLQEEMNMRTFLTNANIDSTTQIFGSSILPHKVLQLISSIIALEAVISRLEEDLISLRFRLNQERNKRPLTKANIMEEPILSPPSSSGCSWEHASHTRVSRCSDPPFSSPLDTFVENRSSPAERYNRIHTCDDQVDMKEYIQKVDMKENVPISCSLVENLDDKSISLNADDCFNNNYRAPNLWQGPNELSEEMVRCMRNIFLHLSESTTASSDSYIHHPSAPLGHHPCSQKFFLGSTLLPSHTSSPSTNEHQCFEGMTGNKFDLYGVNWREGTINFGFYSLAAEVSWMTVGKKHLEYAAEALKAFRFLVEKLASVDPGSMNYCQKLAFWINLYNALIMHAYLAYGVPRSDMKFFSLMQKASYIIGGRSISAADIEYVILKMKPPDHRPQIAMVLALHRFKMLEDLQKFSIDTSEPLAVFALSCGAYSSPAVRIFSPSDVNDELQNSLRDYVRASTGISEKGKLLVPKLLHCFAKGMVEDSLLVDWICRFLSPEQVSVVRDSTSQTKQRLLGARSFSVLPFDSRFRYVFLPDNDGSRRSP